MKKILFTTILFLTIIAHAFAKGNENKDLFKELSSALSLAKPSTYKTTDTFKSTAFTYNGKTVEAFYDDNSHLFGFSMPVSISDLPAGAQESIEKKFSEWQISEAMMLINSNGTSSYFVLVTNAKAPAMILKLNTKNQPLMYANM